MIIRFVGAIRRSGKNKINYFLEGKNGKREKEKVEILEGDLESYMEIEKKFCEYKVKGYHYVISFKENPEEFYKKLKKNGKTLKELYEEIKNLLFYPYNPEDLNIYAVAHSDTDNFHIHIYVSNYLLPINRALRIPKTKDEVELYQKISEYFNKKYDFEFERRGVSYENFLLLKKLYEISPERIFSFSSRQEKEKIKEELTNILKDYISLGIINKREEIKKYFEEMGIEVTRYGKNYMTIKFENKRIRLKGGIYDERAFEEIKRELQANFKGSRRDKEAELRRIQEEIRSILRRRKELIEKKYKKHLERNELLLREETELFGKINDNRNNIDNDNVIVNNNIDVGSEERDERSFTNESGDIQDISRYLSRAIVEDPKSEFEEVWNMNLDYKEVLEEIRQKELEEIKLADPERILEFYGLNYKKTASGIYYMQSPLREDKNPSFVVFYGTKRDCWVFYDCGTGWSGSIIDFVMEMENCDYQNAVNLLRELYDINYIEEIKNKIPKEKWNINKIKKAIKNLDKYIEERKERLKKKYEKTLNELLNELKDAGRFRVEEVGRVRDKRLLQYLKERKINYIPDWLKEIKYEDLKYKTAYVALGIENVSGAYHLRNPKVKMVLKTGVGQENTYSLIRKKGKKVVVVEGLFDALSIEQYKNFKNYDILILNS
ncbi:MAG: relaxase/mobilization nuclease domain-containing protein, partial [Nautiliaceae bacterium]